MERMYFFDSTSDDKRVYQAADFARFHAQIIGDGVSNDKDLPNLKVTAATNLQVTLGAGYMFANGYMYENSTTKTMKHDIANATNDRIDRIVIRFDSNPEKRTIKAVIKKGTASAAPSPPSAERSTYIHEMSVAQVRIKAGKSVIAKGDVTDERANDAVCGFIPLHNIYRGIDINELGMVTMPEQSYVEMVDSKELTLDGTETIDYTPNDIPIRPDIDKQREVNGGLFRAKADGVYQFYFHIALETSLKEKQKIEAYLIINDEDVSAKRVYLFNQPGVGYSDLHFLGSGIKFLNKGDRVKLNVSTRNMGKVESRYRRMSIAKIN